MNRNPQAEAWGYALSSLRERIATKHNNRLALRAKTTTTCSLREPKPCDSPRMRRQRVATGFNPWSPCRKYSRGHEYGQSGCLLPPFHGGLFGMNRNPQAEAWGYALSSLRERIATKRNITTGSLCEPNHNNVLAPRAKTLRFAANAAAARSHGFQPVVGMQPKPRTVNTAKAAVVSRRSTADCLG